MNKLDQQEFDTAEELVNAVQKHFGVDVKVDNQQHQKCIWLCGSTGKKIIGITYFFSRGMWTIGGQVWTPDFTIEQTYPTITNWCYKCKNDTEHTVKSHNGTNLYTCNCGRTVDYHYNELNPEQESQETRNKRIVKLMTL